MNEEDIENYLLEDFSEPDPPDDTDKDRNYDPGEEENTSSDSSQENIQETNERKRTRKQLRNEKNWKRKKAQALRNSGQTYTNYKGNQVNERSVKPYDHTCRYRCREISDDERKSVFTDFWGLKLWDLQTSFINGCMELCAPKKPMGNAQNHRQKSVCLKLLGKRVCKSFFIKTLDISQKRYDNVKKKKWKLKEQEYHQGTEGANTHQVIKYLMRQSNT